MPTAEEWRPELEHELAERTPRTDLFSDYYNGEHRLSFATSKFNEAFGDMFKEFATNWCALVVDVAAERLAVLGFRFGEDQADEDAWAIWQANRLDAQTLIAHTEAIKCETSYLLVGPVDERTGQPAITVEHPNQFIVAHDPANRLDRLAALKKYRATNGDVVAVVYLPDEIVEFRRNGNVDKLVGMGVQLPIGLGDYEVVDRQENPLGIVPGVPLENAPGLLNGGTSDLAPAVKLNDAANKFFTDMIVASEYMAFPQRVLTGVQLPKDPVTGEVIEEAQLAATLARVWAFENKDANVFQLPAGQLSNYVEGVDLAVQHLAAQTRTPPHYLLAKLANLSGDALKAAETGLVARCRRKHLDFSDSHEEAMRLAFMWRARWHRRNGRDDEAKRDEDRAKMTDAETIWRDPESKEPINLTQSLSNKRGIGVPEEVLWEEAGYTPQQIKRMKTLREAELKAETERQLELQRRLQAIKPPTPTGGTKKDQRVASQ